MMAVRSSELHRPGDTVYRCGPCRRGTHNCIGIRCRCTETERCGGEKPDLEHAEQTLRRLQAERAAAEPATPPAPVTSIAPASPGQEPTQRQQILRLLVANGGSVSDPGGLASRVIVEALDIKPGVLATALYQLQQAELIEREYLNARRVTRISITDAGREAVGSSPGVSGADEAPTPPASVQPVGRDNPAGAVSEAPGDEPSGSSGGQGSPHPAVPVDAAPAESAVPLPEGPVADVEAALLADRLRARLRRALVLAVDPFSDGGPRDAEWYGRLFDLFDLGDPT